MRMRSMSLAAAVAAIVTVPTAAHAGPEDSWRHVYFLPQSTFGDFEAAGSHEVWHIVQGRLALWPSVSRWTGGATWQNFALPGLNSVLLTQLTDVDAVGPNEAWVYGYYLTGINPDISVRYLARWDGVKWTRVPAPTPNGSLGILSANAGGTWFAERDRVFRRDGDAWTHTGTLDGLTRELHTFGPDSALARTDSGLWRWDGTNWSKVPGQWPAAARITGPDSAWYADTGGLHTWDGASWQTTPYPEPFGDVSAASAVSESGGLWVATVRNGAEPLLRWRDGAWTYYNTTPYPLKQVIVDGADRVWAVERHTRLIPNGGGHTAEHKGRVVRLDPSGLSWNPVSLPDADYRVITLPGSDRIYAYGRNGWTGTDHVTTNASPLP
ncbi:hypothetical protein [Actinocorallia sp. A-T 12471]|uniref:hypothetical protein n=1 Tax=Actinocorallia sp. A-T 12471 TaxID=3089813 RepID=UPI0029D07435|nr:hypothetical protein [Actinocorallia sp. A-T 12471]MDX6741661.1 hypothetical protein [Actinocorallia sp. A-T 12471]